MLLAVVGDTAYLDFAILDRILDRSPALQPRLLPSVRAVQQEQINIP